MGNLAARLVIFLLENSRLSNESRQLLTASMIDRLGALPMRARIVIDETGKCFVDGKALTLETAQRMRESSRSMRNNFARKFVRDQVKWMALQKGVYENMTPEQGLFAKAALWVMQEEDELYASLGQYEAEETEERTL